LMNSIFQMNSVSATASGRDATHTVATLRN
jgi:hypothetical protein